ncbi:MAG: hypothetical protein L0L25_14080, partial [Enterococcus sp.]|nr:hypothetical protein [Enterococcus sp.]
MHKKKYGVLLWFLLMVLFPVRVDASHHGLTVDQQKEKLESYNEFYQAAFSGKEETTDFGMYKI